LNGSMEAWIKTNLFSRLKHRRLHNLSRLASLQALRAKDTSKDSR